MNRGELGFGLNLLGFSGLEFGFRFCNLRFHLRRAEFDKYLSLFHRAAAVHQNPQRQRSVGEGCFSIKPNVRA